MTREQTVGVTVARVRRPHGRRGEVAAEVLTDFPERLTKLHSAELRKGDCLPKRVGIRSCRLSPGRKSQAIIHFEGSDSISGAEQLVGSDVQVPLAERMPLPPGSYYVTDLAGCLVRETNGAAIGPVRDVVFTGEDVAGTPLLVVDTAAGELLIPLAEEICVHVDLPSSLIEVLLPEGLLELNRDS